MICWLTPVSSSPTYREHKGQRSRSEERRDEHEHEDLDDQMVIPGHPLEDRDDGEEFPPP